MADRQSRTFFGIYINGQQADSTLKELRGQARMLQNEMANLKPGSEAYMAKLKELRQVQPIIQKHKEAVNGLNTVWSKVKTEVKAFGAIALATLGGESLFDGLNRLISRSADLSDIMADVKRTTGLTNQELDQLNRELGTINTRSGRKELLELSKEAGKLGIEGVQNVRKFVEEADQIQVALGEDLGEGAIISIGKLANIFKTDMLKIGSALNEVGAAGIASEGWQVDFLNRLAGVAEAAKLSLPDLLSWGATLESLGQTAEVSGTAMSQLFLKLIRDTREFEKIAGFAEGELSQLIGEQGTSAGLQAFIEKLKESSVSTQDLAQRLDKLGIDGMRSAGVLLSLSENTEMVSEQFEIAKKGFEEGTSVTKEFETRMQTFGAAVDLVRKRLLSAFMNNAIVRGIQNMIIGISEMINRTETATEKIESERVEMNRLVYQITDVNTSTQRRVELIEELKQKYPDFLKFIDLDKASNEELLSALQLVNQEYGKRIVLATRGEELAEQQQQMADAEAKMIEMQLQVDDLTAKFSANSNLVKKYGESAFDYVKRVRETLGTSAAGVINTDDRELNKLFTKLESSVVSAKQLQGVYNKELEETNRLQSELLVLQEKLGLAEMGPDKLEFSSSVGSNTPITPLKEESEEALKKLEEIQKKLKEIRDEGDLSTSDFFKDEMFREEQKRKKQAEADKARKDAMDQLMASTFELMDAQDAEAESFLANAAEKSEKMMEQIALQEKVIESYVASGMAIAENAESQAEATKMILNDLRNEIKAIIAKTIASYISNLFLQGGALGPLGLLAVGLLSKTAGSVIGNIFENVVPDFAVGGYSNVTGLNSNRKYQARMASGFAGGFTSGPMLVGEEGIEYTIPSWMMNAPMVVDTVGLLETIRQAGPGNGLVNGPVTNNSSTTHQVNNYGMESELTREVLLLLRDLRDNGVFATLDDRTIRKLSKRQQLLNDVEQNSRV